MFGKEYLEIKEVQQAVEAVEAALSEFSDSVQSKAKDEFLKAMDAQRQQGDYIIRERDYDCAANDTRGLASRILGGGYA